MDEVKPTAEQKKLIRCFQRLEKSLGREPTAAELGRELEVSRWAIHSAMQWICRKGLAEYRGTPGPWKLTRRGKEV